jgi:PGF-CTERM protein
MESGEGGDEIWAVGESRDLGYGGYMLTVMRMEGADSRDILLVMSKGSKGSKSRAIVDRMSVRDRDRYHFNVDVDGVSHTIFETKIKMIGGADVNAVRLTDFRLYSDGSPDAESILHDSRPLYVVIDYLHITADVKNGYAVTSVEEKLTNSHDTATDDEFRFLIPDGAFISGFCLFIDGVEYEADVLPKKEADERFEVAVSEGRTAGVLKTKKENIFSYSLSFEPHQSIIVRLTYEQPVKKMLGEHEYVLSLRDTDAVHNVPDLSVNITVTSVNRITDVKTPGFDGGAVKYISSTKARVTYGANALPDRDLTIVFTTGSTSINGEMLFYETGGHGGHGGQGYLMHVFSPSVADLGTTNLSKEIIFVIDRSGSMSGDKIAQVKNVFTGIIADLPPDDYFNAIFFDNDVMVFRDALMVANTRTKAEAANFVDALESGGGTNINDALLTALGMFEPGTGRVPIIVFLTDGEPTAGVTSPYVIRENVKTANEAEVSVFTIAFGIEDEGNYDFLRALSLENCGTAERFYPSTNAETAINTFYETISTPVITNMDFSYSDVDASDIVNTGYNTLFAGSDAIVLAKYPSGTGSIDSSIDAVTRTGKKDFDETFSVVSDSGNAFIPKLWAYTKIRHLMDQMLIEGETNSLVSGVTELSLEFGFVTPYTSLFVEVPTTIYETEPSAEATANGADDADRSHIDSDSAPKMYRGSDTDVIIVPTSQPLFGKNKPYMAPLETVEEQVYVVATYVVATVVATPVAVETSVKVVDVAGDCASTPNSAKTQTPGFGVVVAAIGVLVAVVLLRKKNG